MPVQPKKTVFILGAGASAPYGYPTASQILDKLENTIKNTTDLNQIYDQLSPNQELPPAVKHERIYKELVDFELKLRGSGKLTIDEFLLTQSSLRDIGKFALTQILLEDEMEGRLLKNDWCQWIWRRLTSGTDKPADQLEPRFMFITYNYDTSLEHIFYRCIRDSYSAFRTEAVEGFFNNMPIIHVHGKIKKFSWEKERGDCDTRVGSKSFSMAERYLMSKGIRLIHEGEITPELELAKEYLDAAENIVFMGFSFDTNNVKELDHDILFKDEIKHQGGSVEYRESMKSVFRKKTMTLNYKKQPLDFGDVIERIFNLSVMLNCPQNSIQEFLDVNKKTLF